ncbi:hypothetical protein M5362_10760 [Streptomyces sp. Je 1-79]|uniref:hypothetical protein n=1 Tax=Streptomyces sp. Je 1-79 TaxID=2943847 RepID=UPI0021A7F990|nr:hypothetical protein [Streptomyces sp. Je 1-79]MCT4353608.1 hypothetical protein [Streptomyces sp. Je 1-79]
MSSPSPDVAVAPQIVEGPAREALEAALPAPPPPSPRPTPREVGERDGSTVRNGAGAQRQSSAPRQRTGAEPFRPPEPPEPPRSPADMCELGERYGGWHPDSVQATICRGTYQR